MLIRHAEKAESKSPMGVREDGSKDKHSLIVRGWQRAGALVAFFEHPRRPGVATPGTIFASKTSDDPSLPKEEARSKRPPQTVQPLAARLGLTPETRFSVGEEHRLIDALRACEGVVLVAWEHQHLPVIAGAFAGAPSRWGDRFDMLWVLDRRPDGTYALTVLNQDVLGGDVPA